MNQMKPQASFRPRMVPLRDHPHERATDQHDMRCSDDDEYTDEHRLASSITDCNKTCCAHRRHALTTSYYRAA